MSTLDYLSPLSHTKIYLHSYTAKSNFNFHHLRNARRFIIPNSLPVRVLNHPTLLTDSVTFNLWRALKLKPNYGCAATGGQESDSGEKSEEGKSVEPSSGSSGSNRRREKQGKGGWWWWLNSKAKWEPMLQAQEVGVLLLQLGIVIFVMRLLRPGIPLPGSEPRATTSFVSVPYSEFLSKINSDKVQKVEVDGVHIMFKLKSEVEGGEVGSFGSSRLQQESESLVKSVAPTKRIVYTTTRPSDIRTPYERMLENEVEFGSPDKRSGGFFNSALIAVFYVAVLAGLLHRFPVSFSQHTTGQIRNRKSGTSAGTKSSEKGEAITFADVAGVDEAKEELEEIVGSNFGCDDAHLPGISSKSRSIRTTWSSSSSRCSLGVNIYWYILQ